MVLSQQEAGSGSDSDSDVVVGEHGLQDECPPFDGVLHYAQLVAGGTLMAARSLINGSASTAFHWDGGRHHAVQDSAKGFCYVNDVVLGALALLQTFPKVLIIDLDTHHGDGTETAFYNSDKVFTVSVHEYGPGLYPGTGEATDVGEGEGLHHNINIPLQVGCTDESYVSIVFPVLTAIFKKFKPTAVIVVCGADALAGDPIGNMNLTIEGYLSVLKFIKSWDTPTLILGGGGYCVPNTARLWAAVTSLWCTKDTATAALPPAKRARKNESICPEAVLAKHLLHPELQLSDSDDSDGPDFIRIFDGSILGSDDVPEHHYLSLYEPTFKMGVEASKPVVDRNTPESLQKLLSALLSEISWDNTS